MSDQPSLRTAQVEAVTRLSGPERYSHFVKQAVTWGVVWGLWQDGWALSAGDSKGEAFPLWPAAEYAALCANQEWTGFEVAAIEVEDLMTDLLPKLLLEGVEVAVFPTRSNKSVFVGPEQLLFDLGSERERY